ncbi:hypothetical protein ABPG75_006048 [Micractinium tetrahymenae]
MAALQVKVEELGDAGTFAEALKRDRLQVIELYTAWTGPTAAAKTAWRKLAVDMGGPLPCDLSTACLDRMQGAPGGEPLAAFPLTSEPQWVLFKRGKQVAAVTGMDLPQLMKAVQRFSAETPAVARETEC